ncbi:DUF6221 family protein [Streptomyces sp. NPDC005786]|uniref:DUF6221 family protein n=1 Tax=Streptomyces sp. NPDC005786 TaxID=3154891 RepID=UPI0033CE1E3E
MTDVLVQFVRARLDEDRECALKAASRVEGGSSWAFAEMEVRAGDGAPVTRHTWADEGAHIARHDPDRVLHEVAAKRLQLDEALASRHHISPDQYETCPVATTVDGLDETQAAALERLNEEQRQESGGEPICWVSCGRDARVRRTLELLAMPYSEHPGYTQALAANRA